MVRLLVICRYCAVANIHQCWGIPFQAPWVPLADTFCPCAETSCPLADTFSLFADIAHPLADTSTAAGAAPGNEGVAAPSTPNGSDGSAAEAPVRWSAVHLNSMAGTSTAAAERLAAAAAHLVGALSYNERM